jgi:hypothetical protein
MHSHDEEGPTSMKFILVNHRTPSRPSNCIECARSLETGYLREVSTQHRYCDHNCYSRYEAKSLFMPWLAVTRAAHGPATTYPAQLGMIAPLAIALYWCYAAAEPWLRAQRDFTATFSASARR